MSVPVIESAASGDQAGQFSRSGYTVQPRAISPESAHLIAAYALLQQKWPNYYQPEGMYRAAFGRYADAFSEALLLELLPVMEQATGLKLLPCYSYLRIYGNGAILPKHMDRPSCEISSSLTLGFKAPAPWPLCVQADGVDKSLVLMPGDMIVYRGSELPHWREIFNGEYWVQTFLHYVSANGRFTDYKFDGRERIGPFDKLSMRRVLPRPANPQQHYEPATAAPNAPCSCGSGLRFRDCHGQNADNPA
jgi:SEC-C motif